MKIENLMDEQLPLSLEEIFHDWIEYLVNEGHVRKENINWNLLKQAIVEMEYQSYCSSGRKTH